MIDKQLRQLVLDFLDDIPKAFSISDFFSRVGEQEDVSADEISVQRAEFFFIENGYLTKDSTQYERAADIFTDACNADDIAFAVE